MVRYFEDIELGESHELGTFQVSRDEIEAFARKYDPHQFHLTEEGVEASVFDDIVASGVHTFSLMNRVLVDDFLNEIAVLGGRGLTKLDLTNPVYPGIPHTVYVDVQSKNQSSSHSDHGEVLLEVRVRDPDGNLVLAAGPQIIIQR